MIGEYAPAGSHKKLRELRKSHGLTQPQLAVLARSTISENRKGQFQARRVQAWEKGKVRIPLVSWELICAKLKMMDAGYTFEEIIGEYLGDIVERHILSNKDFSKSTDSDKSI